MSIVEMEESLDASSFNWKGPFRAPDGASHPPPVNRIDVTLLPGLRQVKPDHSRGAGDCD